jgi:DNA-binding transcriptional LysR family regulator
MNLSNASPDSARLDSELLRTFLAVAVDGSFSRAAARIFRSQSAVSLQIKQLEQILGRTLFRRHARGVELTRSGEKLRPAAEKIVALLDRAAGELRDDPLRGELRLGIPDEYGGGLLSAVVAQFLRDYPRVELSVRCGFSAAFPAALKRGDLDLAVHAVENPGPGTTLLRRERIYWVASSGHDVQARDPLPVALFDGACWWRARALESLESSGRDYQVVFSSESVTGVVAAVAAGAAVGVLGESSLRPEFARLAPRDGFPALPDSALVLQTRPGVVTDAARALGDAIGEAFGRGGDDGPA